MTTTRSVAIVTGASQGIGRATALRIARDFSAVVLAARDANALEEVADVVKTANAEPLICKLDLSRTESSEALVRATLDRFGRIDALLNIAGAVPQIDLFEMTDEQWRGGMELKLHGARRVTILAWKALKQSKGSVVFMSGSAALDPKPAFAAVAATNAAITALAKAFRRTGYQGRCSGQQHRARCSNDGTQALIPRTMGTRAQNERRRSDETVSGRGGD
jgi:3-oxoacyl-[acyl-carrier protein] reductase